MKGLNQIAFRDIKTPGDKGDILPLVDYNDEHYYYDDHGFGDDEAGYAIPG
jgi:hypothetical protein